mmetsp:Transcript_32566/g.57605  ORF Transcript_32566/g.57605 Transcript_32566/m.57605 type:complete len:101 (+) Transcript_32566:3-305(+)
MRGRGEGIFCVFEFNYLQQKPSAFKRASLHHKSACLLRTGQCLKNACHSTYVFYRRAAFANGSGSAVSILHSPPSALNPASSVEDALSPVIAIPCCEGRI